MSDVVLEMWTLFNSPLDQPGKFVVRKFEVTKGGGSRSTADHFIAETEDAVRGWLEERRPGLVWTVRDPQDHKSVVGTWL